MKRSITITLLVLLHSTLWAQEKLSEFDHYFTKAGVQGSFSLYDLNKKQYYTTDIGDFNRATSPASTFKIPNTFIALEAKAISNENELIRWDGKAKYLKSWENDHDLKNAYKNSTVWFYQEIAKRVGEEKYRHYLKKLDYGNKDISGGLTNFWLGSSLKISPHNQLDFLRKLHAEKLGFSDRTYQIGKEVMIEEKTADYTLRAKTGWADTKPTHVGWYVGYIETQGNVYFFATRLYQPDAEPLEDFGAQRKLITRKILSDLKIL